MGRRTVVTRAARVVVKVGSSLLVDSARGRLKHAWLAALAEDEVAAAAMGVATPTTSTSPGRQQHASDQAICSSTSVTFTSQPSLFVRT